jgi:malonyl-CoA/methylmalonyl-CoA synthetase
MTADDLLADNTLPGRWLRRWSERSAWPQLRDLDGRWLTSDEIEDRTRTAACALLDAGLAPGDRFAISAGSSADLVLAHIAAIRAGLTVLPINPSYPFDEVAQVIRLAKPRGAALATDEQARWVREASGEDVVVLGIDSAGWKPAARTHTIDNSGTDDPVLLVFTSGTTGTPKGALLRHRNLLASATAVNIAWRWEPEERLLLALPLFHVHGLGVGVIGSLCAGGAIVLRQRFQPDDIAQCCLEGAELFFGVPTMYQRLVSSGRVDALSSLRLLVSGSGPLSAALAEQVAQACGQIPLERYGMTETMMLTSNPYSGERRPGTVGMPLPGVELRLAPQDSEVQVRGPNVISGYFERPDADTESFTADGWFRTGDLGELDADGYLRLVGRSKELIISGGFNVHPREVEEVLAEHPAVREVAVVGRASEIWGEEVTAVLVADGEIDTEELRALAGARLATYKVPRRFEFAAELPRNALGKIVRGKL